MFFRCETDECHGDALIFFLPRDSSKHVQSGWSFPDPELQLNFLAHSYLHGGLQEHAAFADVHAAQGKVPVIPSADNIRKHG